MLTQRNPLMALFKFVMSENWFNVMAFVQTTNL